MKKHDNSDESEHLLPQEVKIIIDQNPYAGKNFIPADIAFKICFFLTWSDFESFSIVDKKFFEACADFSKTPSAIKHFSLAFENTKLEARNLLGLILQEYSQYWYSIQLPYLLDIIIENAISTRRKSAVTFLLDSTTQELYVTELKQLNRNCCLLGGVGFLFSGLPLIFEITPTKIIPFASLGSFTILQCTMLLLTKIFKDFCNLGKFLRKKAFDDKAKSISKQMRNAKSEEKILLTKFNRSVSNLITLTCIRRGKLPPVWEKIYQDLQSCPPRQSH